jgi:hypothetical protein
VEVHRHFKGKHCLQLAGQGVQQTRNEEEVNSTLLASCSLFGMCFMAALCHIQEDGHCCEDLESNFLVSPAQKKDSSGATSPTHNFCFLFHINNQSGFSGNGIPAK